MDRSDWGQNDIIFGVNKGLSVHIDSKNENVLVLGVRPTQVLDNATITVEDKYLIYFT